MYHLWRADTWQVDYYEVQRETPKSYLLTSDTWIPKTGGDWFTTRTEAYSELLKRCQKDITDQMAYMMEMITEAAQSEEEWRGTRW